MSNKQLAREDSDIVLSPMNRYFSLRLINVAGLKYFFKNIKKVHNEYETL